MVIAIDGPAGSGKSTIAGILAEKLGTPKEPFIYINSGNLYRAICLGCLRSGINPLDPVKALEYAKNVQIGFRQKSVFLDGEDVTEKLHTDEIDKLTAPLSAIVPVRHVVNDLVRKAALKANAVAEGRDMTTVVFPHAEFRFYLDASPDSRAKRRYDQGVSGLSFGEIKKAILGRDEIDKNKAEGSLKIAPGVKYIDTSDLTLIEVYEKLIEIIQEGKSMTKDVGTNAAQDNGALKDTNHSEQRSGSQRLTGKKSENIQTQLQEEYLKNLEHLEEGQLVEGVVVQVTQDQVFINIG